MGTQAGPHPESSETEVQVQSHSPRKDVCVYVGGGGGMETCAGPPPESSEIELWQ